MTLLQVSYKNVPPEVVLDEFVYDHFDISQVGSFPKSFGVEALAEEPQSVSKFLALEQLFGISTRLELESAEVEQLLHFDDCVRSTT